MESRSGRRSRPRRRRSSDDGGVDRISSLHEDLLIQILIRLRCAATAARTTALSRHWRDSALWTHLPELSFRGIAHDAVKSALAKVALPKLSLLNIDVPNTDGLPVEAVASLLRTAARLDPVEFSMAIRREIAIEMLPSFARATSIRLNATQLRLTPPALGVGGEFPVLERLSVTTSVPSDAGALISRCPHLRVLELIYCQDLDTVIVHSATIEELLVIGERRLRGVDIVAPVLKKFTLRSNVSADFSMSLLAPTVENLSWNCRTTYWFLPTEVVWIDGSGMWYLNHLKLETKKHGFVLDLDIGRQDHDSLTHVRHLQGMFPFPNISVLELYLGARGHVYGAVVLMLLRICSTIQRLKLVIGRDRWIDQACPESCPSDQPQNWRSQNVPLMGLGEVEIENFEGSDHEVDFLKLLFRCAPLTKVNVRLASYVVARSSGCEEAYNILKANPAVEFHVYRKHGKEVIYA